tara:strand:- start:384 stop:860 length:477 start_codon:yes stop_codon:yes gene_type:complete
METIMVAIVFVVVLLVALGFYFKFSLQSVEESGERACIVSNTVLLSSVLSMPEIQCSVNGQTELCVDTSKLLVFDPAREYGTLFTTNCNQKIYFEQVYPLPETEESCSTSNYPGCSTFDFYDPGVSYSSSIKISTPATLYYPLDDEYKFGKLIIEVLQ